MPPRDVIDFFQQVTSPKRAAAALTILERKKQDVTECHLSKHACAFSFVHSFRLVGHDEEHVAVPTRECEKPRDWTKVLVYSRREFDIPHDWVNGIIQANRAY